MKSLRNTFTRTAIVALTFASATFSARPASAALIYGQAADPAGIDWLSGYNITPYDNQTTFDNFTLSSAVNLEAIEWTGSPSPAGTYTIHLFATSVSFPASPASDPKVLNTTFNLSESHSYNTYQVHSYTLNSGLSLGPGTYWLSIMGNNGSGWLTSQNGDGSSAVSSGGTTYSLPFDQAFNLYGTPAVAPVPEPGTWAMMAAGAGALALMAFKRKRSDAAAPALRGLAC